MNQQKIMDQKFEDLEKRANETRMQLEELASANQSKLISSNINPQVSNEIRSMDSCTTRRNRSKANQMAVLSSEASSAPNTEAMKNALRSSKDFPYGTQGSKEKRFERINTRYRYQNAGPVKNYKL